MPGAGGAYVYHREAFQYRTGKLMMGAEIKRPGRSLPKATVFSILGVVVIDLMLQIGSLGALDWHQMLDPQSIASQSIASAVVANAWGTTIAGVVTVLILITPSPRSSLACSLLPGCPTRQPWTACS